MTSARNVRISGRRMGIDHVLFITALAYAALILLRPATWSSIWLPLGAVLVLVTAGLAWLLVRTHAGFIAALAWLAFVAIPLVWQRRLHHPYRRAPVFAGSFTPAVTMLIVVNLIIFFLEIRRGGSTNPATLSVMGELNTNAVLYAHQYSRMFTALFLHYGVLHLLFNLMALFVLGPPLEEEIGTALLVIVYLISGLGSSATVVGLAALHWSPPVEVVGASGCIMGIVGAWAGLLLRQREDMLAGQRLRSILTIVALQFVFDLTTREISLTAHLGGLVTGFLIGLVLPLRRPKASARDS